MTLQDPNQDEGAAFAGDFPLEGEEELEDEVEGDEDVGGDDDGTTRRDLLAGVEVAAGEVTDLDAFFAGDEEEEAVVDFLLDAATVLLADLVTDRVGVRDLALEVETAGESPSDCILIGDFCFFLDDFLVADLEGVFPLGVAAALFRAGVLAGVLAIICFYESNEDGG
jgi:hypothetical protein